MNETYTFNSTEPIYLQIMHSVRLGIVAGAWAPGSRVSPVRDLALQFGVNPNTMQRALSELERTGLLYSERTSGRFVTMDAELISGIQNDISSEEIRRFMQSMERLGYTPDQIRQRIVEVLKDSTDNKEESV